ncbi:MAG: ABC transporter ATP-binding protein [Propionibacteriaceae bacterium]|jgi:ABC-2 type transport system ATP-binding protein|nr:ABC transporter ATP-binding protein [Propionibacteriaceae bacterium]
MEVLRLNSLTKSFGSSKVLDGISLRIPQGQVFGFLGENGAGKTTTMKIIVGLLEADSGQVWVEGERVHFGKTRTNRHVGYLPDVPQFYPYMRAQEYMSLCGRVAGLRSLQIKSRTKELLELVGLAGVKKKIGTYSRGMKQRLGMAQALITMPRLLICDEPTSALDPSGRTEILEILREIRHTTTVIFSTHILSDVERICDRAAVLHQGKIVLSGTLADLKAHHGSQGLRIEFPYSEDADLLCDLLVKKFVDRMGETEVIVHTIDEQHEHEVLTLLADHKLVPLSFEVISPSIESLFLEAVK